MSEHVRRSLWIALYAVAMACVESAVVVYLRQLYYPQGFAFPIRIIPDWITAIELGREMATIVMLACVSALAGRDRWQRFLYFCLAFGVWDIFYYVWLVAFLRWPPSVLTWDVLFLIPLPWIGPVLAPLLISFGLIGGSLHLLWLHGRGVRLGFSAPLWGLATAGGLLVLLSFTLDFSVVLEGKEPPPFRWWLFGLGFAMALAALLRGVRALERAR